jgi:hypothetical protein
MIGPCAYAVSTRCYVLPIESERWSSPDFPLQVRAELHSDLTKGCGYTRVVCSLWGLGTSRFEE